MRGLPPAPPRVRRTVVLVHAMTAAGTVMTLTLDQLLPHSFGPEFLLDPTPTGV